MPPAFEALRIAPGAFGRQVYDRLFPEWSALRKVPSFTFTIVEGFSSQLGPLGRNIRWLGYQGHA